MGSEFLVWKNSGKKPRDCLLGKYILEPSHHLYYIFLREHGIHKELTHDRNATAFDTLLHKILFWFQTNGTNYTYISSFFLKDKTLPMMSSPGSISSSPSVQHLQPALQNHADFGQKGMDWPEFCSTEDLTNPVSSPKYRRLRKISATKTWSTRNWSTGLKLKAKQVKCLIIAGGSKDPMLWP